MDPRIALKTFIETELLGGASGAELGYAEDLLLSGLVNSLGIMRLVSFTEQRFGLQIPPEDVIIDHFQTIDALARYVEARSA
jgi:hypothetical protein